MPLAAHPAHPAQIASAPHRVEGQVILASAGGDSAVAGTWVTLHRVGPDSSGPLDSVRTDAAGMYSFRYDAGGSGEAVHFASVAYDGIVYFTPPLADMLVTGDAAQITVFESSSSPSVDISIEGRHIIVAAASESGARRVIEVFELANDSAVTRVAHSDTGSVWVSILPDGATGFAVQEGDPAAGSLAAQDGRVRLVAPFAPGLKQVAYSYELPTGAFPLAIPVTESTAVLEVLIEEPTGRASGAGLQEVEAVTVEGRDFRRYLALDVQPGQVLRLDAPRDMSARRATTIIVTMSVVAVAMLLALAFTLVRGRRRE